MSDERLRRDPLRFRDPQMSRRSVLASMAVGLAGAGAGLLVGCGGSGDNSPTDVSEADTPSQPEISTLRIPNTRSGCNAPFLYARESLLEEGFAEVRSVFAETAYQLIDDVAEGSIDIAYHFIPQLVHAIDNGAPIVMLGPAHTACAQVVAADYVVNLADLLGRRLGVGPVSVAQPGDFAFAASVLQRIDVSPPDDVELVPVETAADMATGLGSEFDAVFTFSPLSFSVLDSGQSAGGGKRHIIFDSFVDTPYNQQLCCALFARREFVEDNPVATKRAIRAVLRALDDGESDPGALARTMRNAGWVVREDYANRVVEEVTFGAWRTHDLADAMRFYGLYLHEAGLIKGTPEELIEKGTDLTFFNELNEELAYAPGGGNGRLSFYCDPSAGRTALAQGVPGAEQEG